MKKLDSHEEIIDMLEAWIEFLRDPESEIIRKLELSNKEIREAKDELHRLSRDSKERELYFMREKSLKDEISALSKAKDEGREEGIKEIAINLLDVLDDEIISLKTGLSLDEIRILRGKK